MKVEKKMQFEFSKTSLDDVFLVQKSTFEDIRGSFIKLFNEEEFTAFGLNSNFKEAYYSSSSKGVLRGMHYQNHPHGHAKLVSVIEGEILDVVVGVGGKNNYHNKGLIYSTILSRDNNRSLYIPEGYAHGFLVLSDSALVVNHMTSIFNPQYDTGIHFNSFGFNWPIKNPTISFKDANLIEFGNL